MSDRTKLKRGVKFTHAYWLDAITMKPLVCEITRTDINTCWWKQEGERKAHHCFPLSQADRYVKEILP